MAEPKKKLSRTRGRNRRSHQALSLGAQSKCSNCGAPAAQHKVCANCGYYKGKKIIDVK